MSDKFTQRADARLDYKFDWSDLIQTGDAISTYSLTVDGDIVIDGDSIVDSSTGVQYFVSGGTVDTFSAVTCEINTSNGLEDCRTATFFIVACEDKTVVTADDIRAFCPTRMSDAAIESLICVVQASIGDCVEANYPECVGKQILIYAVCHMIESQGGQVTQKRAANGASISQEFYGTGEGVKSTSAGRMLIQLDSAGCYNALFKSPVVFGVVGQANKGCGC